MDVELHYEEHGSGQALICLHGNGEDGSYFNHQVACFKDRCRVITVDTRGRGASLRGEAPFTLDQFARDLASFMDQLGISPRVPDPERLQLSRVHEPVHGRIGRAQHPRRLGKGDDPSLVAERIYFRAFLGLNLRRFHLKFDTLVFFSIFCALHGMLLCSDASYAAG